MTVDRGAVGESPVVRVCSAEDDRHAAVLDAARATASSVPVVEVGPIGTVGIEPVVLVTAEGWTAYHVECSPTQTRTLVERIDEGELPTRDARYVVEHESDTRALPVPETGSLSVGRRGALAPCGWVAPTVPEDYGRLVAEDAREDPGGLCEDVDALGLLGRGRGDARHDAPLASAWEATREAEGEPVVVVNGNEPDPAADADQLLLKSAPVAVLDGALTVAAAVGATDVVVYANEADDLALERCETAADAIDDALGATVQIASGPDEYRAGEPTMALESLEGADRIEARRTPPGPEEHGLFGRPTAIHTPRTLAQLRTALLSPESFDADDADPGTRIVTVVDDADRATVELSTGSSLQTALGAVPAEDFKLACVGGCFGGFTRTLDTPANAQSLDSANLGTNGAVELFDGTRCTVALAGKRARFAREANCGRCVPCREGSKQLVALLREVYDGEYDSGSIRELTRVMRRTSTCYFGRAASRPVTTAMDAFETEFTAHASGQCLAGECTDDQRTRRPESTVES
ncbi:putative NADH dehydrogenase I, F subunit [Halalkalicoccus jeotgali B3]|uniref:NADH dehydrogenase I, F subunit n=1 Tax=Halalkalicoccus jeotgali (strain DSM 18796 / CECT 7217 / JCM 14584 / KCTC 4019 / B3) TaxID=795797 RepID=D8J4C2_HALJB|nr:NADH-ubiquinone oxidoreductase-F iron-sulfur binding region domain-containing protein [Halalkalicoccus jeotgali]ADJ13484.1 putative NADH dehydrogenase I, F subunit [Halalkalicoccus jeotgali B3]